ncbi:PREDICTED: elongation of very long chain fatty acids protein 4-like [Nicrophorus vespilloides]|uniref:Elongation of very long chain fatty acids protein n=1 Tax=Nicrophorus vespilloides TaxID=110193 RepID=A0ABM1NDB2_NICVS|nr:PREDICTED: elongation of very long chain fatty acids protein 4-like [Nicrophorus vespilloides]
MALLLKKLATNFCHAMNTLHDPRVEDWFLMRSLWSIVGISLLYLYVILDIGPKFMKNRKPFNIDKLMIFYNAAQIAACTYIVVEGCRSALVNYDFLCAPVDYSNSPQAIHVARIVWFYFIVKITDLLDTVFFILRKKENQVSFLHVYHHWGMVALSWIFTKFVPGGYIMYIIVINSFVHIIMYGYYLLTAYNPEFKKSIWWKKHITQLQLLQFGILLAQHLQMLAFQPNCPVPTFLFFILIPQNLTIFSLFADFYFKAYIKPNLKIREQ